MGHVVLLGDSIFDNAAYVPGQPAVIEQVRRSLPAGWQATLLAVDGHMTSDVADQLARLPADATHLFVSAGGNDALGESSMLHEPAGTVGEAFALYEEVRARFEATYRGMLRAISTANRPTTVCTVYDSIPGLGAAERAALAGFNEIILREAFRASLPLIDLRLVCDRAADYSAVSPIEPSPAGGAKIAKLIVEVAVVQDVGIKRSVVYC
jgi:GDSL-like Lipase/Acylhydrolase family